tara:strand:+ start:685 stop:1755 length:1071 start_codon:yes stop_codon:yes gene_type:complete
MKILTNIPKHSGKFYSKDCDLDGEFIYQLSLELLRNGHQITHNTNSNDIDLQLVFSNKQCENKCDAPIVQVIDKINIPSNTKSIKDWKLSNSEMFDFFTRSSAVIYQSKFSKKIINDVFGKKEYETVIHKGTNTSLVKRCNWEFIAPSDIQKSLIGKNIEDIKWWLVIGTGADTESLCASIQYFKKNAPKDTHLCIVGTQARESTILISAFDLTERCTYMGEIRKISFLNILNSASTIINLKYLTFCPDEIIMARAAGCHIVCSSSSGAQEIVGKNSTILKENLINHRSFVDSNEKFDINLENGLIPYTVEDFKIENQTFDDSEKNISDIDISLICKKYINIFNSIVDKRKSRDAK